MTALPPPTDRDPAPHPVRRRSAGRRAALVALALVAVGVALVQLTPLPRAAVAYVALRREPVPTRLPVPVAGVARGRLTDTWGAARSGGRQHEGIDIFAPCGRPVLSATDGLVLHVGPDPLGGKTVTVLGPGAMRHYYAHLSGYAAIRRLDVIAEGDTVGYVGDTGNAKGTPCHLHYGLYTGARIAHNPYMLLAPPESILHRPPAPTRPPSAR